MLKYSKKAREAFLDSVADSICEGNPKAVYLYDGEPITPTELQNYDVGVYSASETVSSNQLDTRKLKMTINQLANSPATATDTTRASIAGLRFLDSNNNEILPKSITVYEGSGPNVRASWNPTASTVTKVSSSVNYQDDSVYQSDSHENFGYSISATERYLVVGSPYEDYEQISQRTANNDGTENPLEDYTSRHDNSGSIHIYDLETGKNKKILNPYFELYGTNTANHEFGCSVSIDGDFIVVGARRANLFVDETNYTNYGTAYVYRASTGELIHQLERPQVYGSGSTDYFGTTVHIHGNYIFVSSYYQNTDINSSNDGQVFAYDLETGKYLYTLNEHIPSGNHEFGSSISASGDYVVVGAMRSDSGATNSGRVHIFDIKNGDHIRVIENPNMIGAKTSDHFGGSVAIHGNYIVVGAPLEDSSWHSDNGAAYVFDIEGNLIHTLQFNYSHWGVDHNNAWFGQSVAIDGSYVYVLSANMYGTHGWRVGKVFVYDLVTGQIISQASNGLQPSPYQDSAGWVSTANQTLSIANGKIYMGQPLFDSRATNSGLVSSWEFEYTAGNKTVGYTSAFVYTNDTIEVEFEERKYIRKIVITNGPEADSCISIGEFQLSAWNDLSNGYKVVKTIDTSTFVNWDYDVVGTIIPAPLDVELEYKVPAKNRIKGDLIHRTTADSAKEDGWIKLDNEELISRRLYKEHYDGIYDLDNPPRGYEHLYPEPSHAMSKDNFTWGQLAHEMYPGDWWFVDQSGHVGDLPLNNPDMVSSINYTSNRNAGGDYSYTEVFMGHLYTMQSGDYRFCMENDAGGAMWLGTDIIEGNDGDDEGKWILENGILDDVDGYLTYSNTNYGGINTSTGTRDTLESNDSSEYFYGTIGAYAYSGSYYRSGYADFKVNGPGRVYYQNIYTPTVPYSNAYAQIQKDGSTMKQVNNYYQSPGSMSGDFYAGKGTETIRIYMNLYRRRGIYNSVGGFDKLYFIPDAGGGGRYNSKKCTTVYLGEGQLLPVKIIHTDGNNSENVDKMRFWWTPPGESERQTLDWFGTYGDGKDFYREQNDFFTKRHGYLKRPTTGSFELDVPYDTDAYVDDVKQPWKTTLNQTLVNSNVNSEFELVGNWNVDGTRAYTDNVSSYATYTLKHDVENAKFTIVSEQYGDTIDWLQSKFQELSASPISTSFVKSGSWQQYTDGYGSIKVETTDPNAYWGYVLQNDTNHIDLEFTTEQWGDSYTQPSVLKEFIDGTPMTEGFSLGTDVTGPIGKSARFNGYSSYIKTYKYLWESGSLSFWFKADHHVNGDYVYYSPNSYNVYGYNGRLSFRPSSSHPITDLLTPTTVFDGKWHHLVFVHDQNSSWAGVYMDGVLVDSINRSFTMNTGWSWTYIGASNSSIGSNNARCNITQLRTFTSDRPANEIAQWYNSEFVLFGRDSNTHDFFGDGSAVATWRLDGDSNDLGGLHNAYNTSISFEYGGNFGSKVMRGNTGSYSYRLYAGPEVSNHFIGEKEWAISVWFKLDDVNNYNTLFGGYSTGYGVPQVWIENGKLRYMASTNGSSPDVLNQLGSINVKEDEWNHLVFTRYNNRFYAFVNGSQDISILNYASLYTGWHNFSIGASGIGSNSYQLRGTLSQMRIFNRGLTSTEARNLLMENKDSYTLSKLSGIRCSHELNGIPYDTRGIRNDSEYNDITYNTEFNKAMLTYTSSDVTTNDATLSYTLTESAKGVKITVPSYVTENSSGFDLLVDNFLRETFPVTFDANNPALTDSTVEVLINGTDISEANGRVISHDVVGLGSGSPFSDSESSLYIYNDTMDLTFDNAIGNEFTIEMWYKPTTYSNSSYNVIFDNRSGSGNDSYGMVAWYNSSYGLYVGNYLGHNLLYSASSEFETEYMIQNQWNHIAITRDTSANVTRLYLNGRLVDTTTSFSTSLQRTTLRFGKDNANNYPSYGFLSDFSLKIGHSKYKSDKIEVPTEHLTLDPVVGYNEVVIDDYLIGDLNSGSTITIRPNNTFGVSKSDCNIGTLDGSDTLTITGSVHYDNSLLTDGSMAFGQENYKSLQGGWISTLQSDYKEIDESVSITNYTSYMRLYTSQGENNPRVLQFKIPLDNRCKKLEIDYETYVNSFEDCGHAMYVEDLQGNNIMVTHNGSTVANEKMPDGYNSDVYYNTSITEYNAREYTVDVPFGCAYLVLHYVLSGTGTESYINVRRLNVKQKFSYNDIFMPYFDNQGESSPIDVYRNDVLVGTIANPLVAGSSNIEAVKLTCYLGEANAGDVIKLKANDPSKKFVIGHSKDAINFKAMSQNFIVSYNIDDPSYLDGFLERNGVNVYVNNAYITSINNDIITGGTGLEAINLVDSLNLGYMRKGDVVKIEPKNSGKRLVLGYDDEITANNSLQPNIKLVADELDKTKVVLTTEANVEHKFDMWYQQRDSLLLKQRSSYVHYDESTINDPIKEWEYDTSFGNEYFDVDNNYGQYFYTTTPSSDVDTTHPQYDRERYTPREYMCAGVNNIKLKYRDRFINNYDLPAGYYTLAINLNLFGGYIKGYLGTYENNDGKFNLFNVDVSNYDESFSSTWGRTTYLCSEETNSAKYDSVGLNLPTFTQIIKHPGGELLINIGDGNVINQGSEVWGIETFEIWDANSVASDLYTIPEGVNLLAKLPVVCKEKSYYQGAIKLIGSDWNMKPHTINEAEVYQTGQASHFLIMDRDDVDENLNTIHGDIILGEVSFDGGTGDLILENRKNIDGQGVIDTEVDVDIALKSKEITIKVV